MPHEIEKPERLLLHRYVLEYDTSTWVDVHPLIVDIPEFQREYQALHKITP
jgi:hypothetical protein